MSVISKNHAAEFIEIPKTVRLAILMPTVRWSGHVRSAIGSLLGVANEEVAILVGDNSEIQDKSDFLKKISAINPYILPVSHKKNIGGFDNFIFLHDWCRQIEFSAIVADDDWMSPSYHVDAYRFLVEHSDSSCCAAGTTLVDIGDGVAVNVNQPTMAGAIAINRMKSWSASAARVTMYNTSRRRHLEHAVEFQRRSPLNGMTLLEDLWELSRLAQGDFWNIAGHGVYLHYPATRTSGQDEMQRFYDLICKSAGLRFPFVYFSALSTAIQCAAFLTGKLSPVSAVENRYECGQHIFRQIFLTQFLPHVIGNAGRDAATIMFASHPDALTGFIRYCNSDAGAQVEFNDDMIAWFIELIRVFEAPAAEHNLLLSERFRSFINDLLN